jgi:hypothetical protein
MLSSSTCTDGGFRVLYAPKRHGTSVIIAFRKKSFTCDMCARMSVTGVALFHFSHLPVKPTTLRTNDHERKNVAG